MSRSTLMPAPCPARIAPAASVAITNAGAAKVPRPARVNWMTCVRFTGLYRRESDHDKAFDRSYLWVRRWRPADVPSPHAAIVTTTASVVGQRLRTPAKAVRPSARPPHRSVRHGLVVRILQSCPGVERLISTNFGTSNTVLSFNPLRRSCGSETHRPCNGPKVLPGRDRRS